MTQTDRIDGLQASVAIKAPCRVATTANITLASLQTVDGIALAADDRVLVKDQTDAKENGIYVVATSPWPRAKNFNGARDAVQGTILAVTSGTSHGGEFFKVTASAIAFGTTDITFESIGGTLVTPVAILEGGTGATTADGALTNLGATAVGKDLFKAADAATAFSDIKQAATASATGVIELATTAETQTGTDATRAVTPDGLNDMTDVSGKAWVLDEDTMSSNDATKVPTQQSVKAYVDANGGTVVQWDVGTRTTAFSTSSTTPQATGCAVTLNGVAAGNKVVVTGMAYICHSATGGWEARVYLYRNGVDISPGGIAIAEPIFVDIAAMSVSLVVEDSPGSGNHTYEIRISTHGGGTVYMNRDHDGGSVGSSALFAQELMP